MGRAAGPGRAMRAAATAWALVAILAMTGLGASPGPAAATPSPSPAASADASAGHGGLGDRLATYLAIAYPAIEAIRDAMFSGNDGGAGSAALAALAATRELRAWLEATTSDPCLEEAWSALRDATTLLEPMFMAVVEGGAAAAMNEVIRSVSSLEDATAVAERSLGECEPGDAVPAPSGTAWVRAGTPASRP